VSDFARARGFARRDGSMKFFMAHTLLWRKRMEIRRIPDIIRSSRLLHLVGVILGLLIAFGLRVTYLDKFGLWDGELHTVFQAVRSLVDLPAGLRSFESHPLLWYVLVHFLLGLEPSMWILRFPAVLVGTASVAAGYVLARRFLPRHWSLTAMFLLAISPISLRWSQSVRMYAAFMLLSTLSFYLALQILDARHKLAWLGFGLVTLLNLYTHYFAIFPLIAEAVWLVLVIVWSFCGQASGVKNPWLVVRHVLLATAVIAVGYLPWFWLVARFNFIAQRMLDEQGYAHGVASWQLFYRLFEDLVGSVVWLTPVLLLLTLLGFLHLLRHRRYRDSVLIALGILVPVAVVIGVNPHRFHAKYVAYAMPLLVILMVEGIIALKNLVLRLIGRRMQRWAVVSFSVVVGALMITGVPSLLMDYRYYNGDPEVYQQSTEPNIWFSRGPWPQFMQYIKDSDSSFLFSICLPENRCPLLAQQVAIHTYLTPGARERLLTTDWTTEDELDVWWIFGGRNTDVKLQALNNVPLGQRVMVGPNHQLWRTHLRVNSAKDILPNGSFEALSTIIGNDGRTLAVSWHVNKDNLGNFEIVSNPTFHGSRALWGMPEERNTILRSDSIPMQPGTLLHASMQVYNLALKFHDTTPSLALNFEDAKHETVKSNLTTYYYLPHTGDGTNGWQQLTVQAIAPQEARYVALSIEFGFEGKLTKTYPIEDRQPAIVDDVHLIAIEWEEMGLAHGPLVGGVTDTSAVIWMRAEAPPEATIVAKLATESTFENALTFPFSSSGPDATWKASATGLQPHTTYYVDIESNGESQMRGRYSKFTTFVPRGVSADFRFAILTDFFGNANSGVFEQVAQHESSLDFVYLGGDFWHRNIDDMQGKRDRFKFMYSLYTPRGYASYFVHGILSQYPVAHCYDDHDMGVDNADKTYPKKAETLQVLQEFFPTYPMSPHGCWQKFSYGQADFFILDTRSQRDPAKTPDGPGKSLLDGDDLGDEGQWRWLEKGLLNSTAKWKFIFSGSPFNPTVKKRDAWYGYPDERDRLIELIRSNGIQGVVIISGDLHAGGIDDGSNAAFPEMLVPSPNWEHCLTTNDIGVWSHGSYSRGEDRPRKERPPCPGYGVVSVMTDPDRILMQVKNDEGETELEMLYSLEAD
jgi:alkaline phosphatase D